jgi:Putative beta-barrel porin-2, OmpL-like. bbp2
VSRLFIRHLSLSIAVFFVSTTSYADEYLPDPIVGYVMGDTLQFRPNPLNIQSETYGDWSVQAIATGLGFQQSNPVASNYSSYAAFTNLQANIQKTDGPLKVFVLAGSYSLAALGQAYIRSSTFTESTFGYMPEAYIALSVTKDWSISLGKLPSMGGLEAAFTYENPNIQRGLLWTQTNSVSRGVQVNYQEGNVSAALSVNDGAYSGVYNWIGGLVNIKTSKTSEFTVSWTGSMSGNSTNTTATPLLQNNSQISNLIYQYTGDRWSVKPYFQYTYIPSNPNIGLYGNLGTVGYAVLTTYHVDPLTNGVAPNRHISIPTRLEYQSSYGNSLNPNLPAGPMYGPGSSAWSATITPTIQSGRTFARVELSFVKTFNPLAGSAFGATGTNNTQTRAMLEVGLLY